MTTLTDICREGAEGRAACLRGAKVGLELIELKQNMNLADYTTDVKVDLDSFGLIVDHQLRTIIPHLDYLGKFGCKTKDTELDIAELENINPICISERLVIAGGYAAMCINNWLHGRRTISANDIDLYPPAGADIPAIVRKLSAAVPWRCVTHSEYSVTFRVAGMPNVQLVLSPYESVSQLVTLFDIPAVSCALIPLADGLWTALATREALWQIHACAIIFDKTRISFNYMDRLVKYRNKGFNIWFPHYAGENGKGEIEKFEKEQLKTSAYDGSVVHAMARVIKGDTPKMAAVMHNRHKRRAREIDMLLRGKSSANMIRSSLSGVAWCLGKDDAPNFGVITDMLTQYTSPPINTIPIAKLIQDSIDKTPKGVCWYGQPVGRDKMGRPSIHLTYWMYNLPDDVLFCHDVGRTFRIYLKHDGTQYESEPMLPSEAYEICMQPQISIKTGRHDEVYRDDDGAAVTRTVCYCDVVMADSRTFRWTLS